MFIARVALVLSAGALCGCTSINHMPASGPSSNQLRSQRGYEVVPLTRDLAQALAHETRGPSMADLPVPTPFSEAVAIGDVIEVGLWEAAPAMLLGIADAGAPGGGRGLAIRAQVVRLDGSINVPFVGRILAAGKTPTVLEAEMVKALDGRANRPQALVSVGSAIGQEVTIVGAARNNLRITLTARRERLLDAIALAGGSAVPIEKSFVQLTRGNTRAAVPLDSVVRDPRQNVLLAPADVVAIYHQPKSFVALGAVAKPGDVSFEATGIDLAQALARAGGALDNRADASGVFIARQGVKPTIYQLDLRAPGSLFAMRDFKVEDQDVIYVANASAAELQKFLALLGAAVYPLDAGTRTFGSD